MLVDSYTDTALDSPANPEYKFHYFLSGQKQSRPRKKRLGQWVSRKSANLKVITANSGMYVYIYFVIQRI